MPSLLSICRRIIVLFLAAALLSFSDRPAEFRVVVMGLGGLSGEFQVDKEGRGGLAALHTLLERERRRLSPESGRVLLLHAGNFTGAEDFREFRRKLIHPSFSLVERMKFDALALSASELLYIVEHLESENYQDRRFQKDVARLPVLAFDYGDCSRTKAIQTIKPYMIFGARPLSAELHNVHVFVSGLADGFGPCFSEMPYTALRAELDRQTGADLGILLFEAARKPQSGLTDPANATVELTDDLEYRRVPSHPEQPEFSRDFEKISRELNPYTELQPGRPLLAIEGGASINHFSRSLNGLSVCRVKSRALCRVEFTFRRRRLIAMTQEFIDLNGEFRAHGWVPADRKIIDQEMNPEQEEHIYPADSSKAREQ